MRTLTRQDLMDILHGCVIYGAGGGGDLAEGVSLIDDALAQGKTFDLVSIDEAPPDALVCTPYMLGAISALPPEEEAGYASLHRSDSPAILAAYRRFETYLGRKFYGAISCELGGSNTAIAMYGAAMAGAMIIDADPAGRAVPEITHSGYYLKGLPASPIVMANEFGEAFIAENVVDDQRAETLVRALSMVSRNDIAAIDHALPLSDLDGAIIPGAVTMALTMGRRHRQALAQGDDAADCIAGAGGGKVVFRGAIDQADWRTEAGFTLGDIGISGAGAHDGARYDIFYKNENLVGRLNGSVHATIPELICLVDLSSGALIANPDAIVGAAVAVVILPAPPLFLTEKGLQAFGPGYVGLDHPFRSALV